MDQASMPRCRRKGGCKARTCAVPDIGHGFRVHLVNCFDPRRKGSELFASVLLRPHGIHSDDSGTIAPYPRAPDGLTHNGTETWANTHKVAMRELARGYKIAIKNSAL